MPAGQMTGRAPALPDGIADMSHTLEQLKRHTVVVADTGDFLQLEQFAPRDATTNPSLILKAVQKAEYAPLLTEVVDRKSVV